MIVYSLTCSAGHRFEGWFGSSGEYDDQIAERLIACPHCGCEEIGKAPMAPAIGRKSSQSRTAALPETSEVAPSAASTAASAESDFESNNAVTGGTIPPAVAKAIEAVAKAQAKALKTSEYVGDKFAEESRAIHYGERKGTSIHGKATDKERRDLAEEGISVMPLLTPFVPPDEVN